MLQNHITSEIDKYLQEVAERHERDDKVRVPEFNGHDTSEIGTNHTEHNIQYQDELETIPEEEEDEVQQTVEKQDIDNLDTVAYTPDESEEEPFNTAIDSIPLKTQLLLWANRLPPHSSQMTYTFQLRR